MESTFEPAEGSATQVDRSAHVNALAILRAGSMVFVAGGATLILELVAGRMLSPYVGVSLYTWTTIIGVILAGISFGNWIGGKVADHNPSPRTTGALFLLGGASMLLSLGISASFGDGTFLRFLPVLARTFILTLVLFFPPTFILSMITPALIRSMLPDVGHVGRIVGLVYALGTIGSLIGNFVTGFVLIAYLPIGTIVLGVAGVLLLFGLLGGEWWRKDVLLRLHVGTEVRPYGAHPSPANQEARSNADARSSAQSVVVPRSGVGAGWLRLEGNLRLACIVVVVASFCSMAIELAASRIMAPYFGVSLYSWTGIIGAVLAAIAFGNFVGGRIADLWPRQQVLGISLFLGGLASLAILLAVALVAQAGLFNSLSLMPRIVATTTAIFFVPLLFLGTISPQVTRLAMGDVEHAGRVAGRIYAWSTAGAIAGTFATGWFLIAWLGVNIVVLAAGIGLVIQAILVGRFWRHAVGVVIALLITMGAIYGLSARGALASGCRAETNYYCIKVFDDTHDGKPVKSLVLDHLIHSFVMVGDPSYLGYDHEQVQAEITRMVGARTSKPHILLVGGGGYTYPRWVDAFVPSASMEVVEIDPGVTETAYRDLGLARTTRIITRNVDGRQFIQEMAARKQYDLVVQDAVNDLSVPYHILTKEYDDQIKSILTDDGIYLLTVIDTYDDGQLLRASMRTMMQSFPEVQLLATQPIWKYGGSSVFVIYGSNRAYDPDELRRALQAQGIDTPRTMAQPKDELRPYVEAGPQIVLTDQYAPVDNLISVLFSSRN